MNNFKLISYKFDNNSSYIGVLVEETDHAVRFIPIYDCVDGLDLPPGVTNTRKEDLDYQVIDEIPSFYSILKERYPEMLL